MLREICGSIRYGIATITIEQKEVSRRSVISYTKSVCFDCLFIFKQFPILLDLDWNYNWWNTSNSLFLVSFIHSTYSVLVGPWFVSHVDFHTPPPPNYALHPVYNVYCLQMSSRSIGILWWLGLGGPEEFRFFFLIFLSRRFSANNSFLNFVGRIMLISQLLRHGNFGSFFVIFFLEGFQCARLELSRPLFVISEVRLLLSLFFQK